MAEPEKKTEPQMLSDEEMLKLLLIEDDVFKDEGRDLYMDDILARMRKDLEKDDKEE